MSGTQLLAFSGGTPRFRAVGRRFARNAYESGFFGSINLYDDIRLQREFPEFIPRRSNLFHGGTRGFGYWSWKPFLLRTLMECVTPDVQRILYLDSGCHLNVTAASRARFHEYEAWADEHGYFLFRQDHAPEREWTKPQVLDHFKLSASDRLSGQVWAGAVLVSVGSDRAYEVIAEWERATLFEQGVLLVDPQDERDEGEHLRAHKHDQSLLSCIVKNDGATCLPDETYFHPNWGGEALSCPIWATRNTTRFRFSSSRQVWYAQRLTERLLAGNFHKPPEFLAHWRSFTQD